jgi:hypothetical protein
MAIRSMDMIYISQKAYLYANSRDAFIDKISFVDRSVTVSNIDPGAPQEDNMGIEGHQNTGYMGTQ